MKIIGNWIDVINAARSTVGLNDRPKKNKITVPSEWKKKILLAEHSPIRNLIIRWKWINIKYWVSVHLIRHNIGINHFVSTQRIDRTGIPRDKLPQDTLINHEIICNAQAIINISRKRLCSVASKETRAAWELFLSNLKDKEPELYSVCVRECIYRGFCPEIKSCNWYKTKEYKQHIKKYRTVY